MEDSTKKSIMIGVIVVCLVAAAAITFVARSKGGVGISRIPASESVWMKCRNPDCKAEYEMNKREYYRWMQESTNPMATQAPPMTCEKCGEDATYGAEKCEKCGLVFVMGTVPDDFADRCPECGYSKTEEIRKRAAEARRRK